MVDNKTIQIIHAGISKYVDNNNIHYSFCDGMIKYTINFKNYYIEIYYNFVDSFYKIVLEVQNNKEKKILFLTKSKAFHKDIKKRLRKNKLSKKIFNNHIFCFVSLMQECLDLNNTLDCLEKIYIPNLKFDGMFL